MHPLEAYLRDLVTTRMSGAAVPETSYYPALRTLLDAVGSRLKPKVHCVIHLQDAGGGIPDGGLFTAEQVRSGAELFVGAKPARGAVEAKPLGADLRRVAETQQLKDYWRTYGQVLLTNFRQFALLGRDTAGRRVVLETYTLAGGEEEFWNLAAHPHAAAERQGEAVADFLARVMLYPAPLAAPRDLAWFLASYARKAKTRVEAGELAAFGAIRAAFQEALGLTFEGERGDHFFRSALIQTLFYGVFSAWVIWSRAHPPRDQAKFDWRLSAQYLRVPILRKLFHELADPGPLEAMRLREVLDWSGAALNRVDRAAFFEGFEEGHAVQYFYEPFLQEFDPELRKDLGVWYTPTEIVRYMVARVDRELRDTLGVADGFANPNVYVLDPCCGTGAYLVEVLATIARTLQSRGGDALSANDVKTAALTRVFGFEILPAPFVVAHLQLGLLLHRLGAPLSEASNERPGVYLTNALTGWEPAAQPKIAFAEMAEERDAADRVKRDVPILVILGNPPYNSFAGIAHMAEERALTEAYRTTRRAPQPQGQGLNDLYVRFFRMADRRIADGTGRGIICFISNYSWLDGLSFTGMRERFLEAFDRIWIDNLHGDRIISEYAPDGGTSETVFAVAGNSPGIRIGTAVSLLARRGGAGKPKVFYCDRDEARAADRRRALLDSLSEPGVYRPVEPDFRLGLSFKPGAMMASYFSWPLLTELFPTSFPGVKTSRDDVVVDIDRDRLIGRMRQYFDPALSDEEIGRRIPGAMESGARFNAPAVRSALVRRGFRPDWVVKYFYRPFDIRWLYWERETKLLDEKRREIEPYLLEGNRWLEARQKQPMAVYDRGNVSGAIPDNLGNGLSSYFPMSVPGGGLLIGQATIPNLAEGARAYLERSAARGDALFFHAVATLHAPRYRAENAAALRQNWPRIPLSAAEERLAASAALGREVAALLDPESPLPAGAAALRVLGAITGVTGKLNPAGGDLEVSAGWGHKGKGGAVMPAKGRVVTRSMTAAELAALPPGAAEVLGRDTCDIYLNDRAFWSNVPRRVWEYTLGGYQVIKKWLSYREAALLGRPLHPDEARYVSEMVRRIAALLLLAPALDANYREVAAAPYALPATPVAPRRRGRAGRVS